MIHMQFRKTVKGTEELFGIYTMSVCALAGFDIFFAYFSMVVTHGSSSGDLERQVPVMMIYVRSLPHR